MLVLFALAIPVLLGMAALVVDVGNLFVERRTLQKSADAAALAAVQNTSQVASLSQKFSIANGGPGSLQQCPPAGPELSGDRVCYTWPYSGNPARVEVVVRKDVSTFFGGLIGKSSWPVTARAVAQVGFATSVTPGSPSTIPGTPFTNPGTTVVVTSPSTPGALPCGLCLLGTGDVLSMNGSPASVTVHGADIIANGNAPAFPGNPDVTADPTRQIIFHGSVDPTNLGDFSPAPLQNQPGLLADPLAYLPAPSFNDNVIPPNAPAEGTTLSPGTYSNVAAAGRTLLPGLYTITGDLTGPFTGTGVLLYFPSCASHPNAFPPARCTSSHRGGFWNSDATWSISPPLAANCAAVGTCAYIGLSVFYDRDYTVTFPLQGNTGSSLSGTIYGLNVEIEFGGGPSLTTTSAIIVRSYDGGGNPELTINYDQATNVQPPIPGGTTTTIYPPTVTTSPDVVTTSPDVTNTTGTNSRLDE